MNTKSVFLTYPQCDISKEDAKIQLLALSFPVTIDNWIIAEEQHQDGSPHLHIVITFIQPFNNRNERFYDLSKDLRIYHPNIQSCRNVRQSVQYCKKDGNFIEDHDWSITDKPTWAEALKQPTIQEYYSYIQENFPRDYVLNLQRIQYTGEHHYKASIPTYQPDPDYSYNVPASIQEWVNSYVSSDARCGSRLHSLLFSLIIYPSP